MSQMERGGRATSPPGRSLARFDGQCVLVTGGTAGIGLATGLAFGARGAQCWLTYRWGSADLDDIRRQFAEVGAPPPRFFQADVGDDSDTAALVDAMRRAHERVDVFVSNASAALRVESLDDYSERGLLKSIHYSAWPMVAYPRAIEAAFGAWPRYVVGMSSTGPDHYAHGYDFVASSKSVMETLCRYLTWHTRDMDVRVNVIRSRAVRTEAFVSTFGADLEGFCAAFAGPRHWVSPQAVADATVAVCSGLLDALRGQVLTVDRGTTFCDNIGRLYLERSKHEGHP